MQTAKATNIFIPHGGGPLPILNDPGHATMVRFLTQFAASRPTPEALVVISAHWEADPIRITAGAEPELLYDYYGFPPESYHLDYRLKGAPELARDMHTAMRAAGIDCELDWERDLDHGVFIPAMLLYPAGGIPALQLALHPGLDPEQHIAIGQALRFLRDRNIMILGSGFSFHNLPALLRPEAVSQNANEQFQSWLLQTTTDTEINEADRQAELCRWSQAPYARLCHPRAEHLLPLFVCYGLGGGPAQCVFDNTIMEQRALGLQW
ncbi:MAG: dioxygenase [Leptospiraceae bacterium]|nr:dioxygenase [Leptospiraceae bacterium]